MSQKSISSLNSLLNSEPSSEYTLEHSQIPELLHADGAPFAKHDGLLQLFQYLRMKLIEREEAGLPRHQASVVAWLKLCLLTAHAVQP